jgi:hypothetical protein
VKYQRMRHTPRVEVGQVIVVPYGCGVAQTITPVFIGGSGRSGTTIALNLLKDHPQFHASLPREIKFLTARNGILDLLSIRPLSLEESAKGIRNNLIVRAVNLVKREDVLTSKEGQRFRKRLFGSWWSETGKAGKPRGLVQAIDHKVLEDAYQQLLHEFPQNGPTASRNFFYTLALAQIKKPDVHSFGDSTPINMMHSARLYELFPEAKFVNVIRDGRDVALSVTKERWGPNDPYEALSWWANRVLKSARALAQIPQERRFEMRLEDLVTISREATFDSYMQFLKLPEDVAVRKYFSEEVSPDRLHQGRWKSEVENPNKFNSKYMKILEKLELQGVAVRVLL